ncbi:hypothetical protein Tco_0918299 [Tanacetum coccineum]
MWKLKIAEGGGDKWLSTTNKPYRFRSKKKTNHIGRQHWEFDPDAGTEEERAEIERIRLNFKVNRFHVKQSADLLMRGYSDVGHLILVPSEFVEGPCTREQTPLILSWERIPRLDSGVRAEYSLGFP